MSSRFLLDAGSRKTLYATPVRHLGHKPGQFRSAAPSPSRAANATLMNVVAGTMLIRAIVTVLTTAHEVEANGPGTTTTSQPIDRAA
jgi:hypothetical protein